MGRFSRRQKIILPLLMATNLSLAVCCNTQGPLFPKLAEDKGVKASQYGLVFGIYQLSRCLSGLVFGYVIRKTGTKNMLCFGAFIAATFFIIFGNLYYVNGATTFFTLAVFVRTIEGCGAAALKTAFFTIIIQEFPDSVGTVMSLSEMAYGIGLILGPTLGGALCQAGGYPTPFITLGTLLLLVTFVNFFTLPTVDITVDLRSDVGIFTLLKLPEISIAMYSAMATANNIGFIQTALEPHLRIFELTPTVVGFIFVIPGGCYGLFTILYGKLCDAGISPTLLTTVAGIIAVVAYLFMGPAPFLNIEISLWLLCISLILHGIGGAGELIPSFVISRKTALDHGLPNNLSTLGLISGLYNSVFSLGAFIGPVVTGVLIDKYGVRYSTLYNVALHILVVILNIGILIKKYINRKITNLSVDQSTNCDLSERRSILNNIEISSYESTDN